MSAQHLNKPVIRYLAILLVTGLLFGTRTLAEEASLPYVVPEDYLDLPPTALIETSKGPFEIRLYRKETPASVANFTYLVEQKMYENVAFHKYTEDFIIQGGDPTGTGKGGPGWSMLPEISPNIRHLKGAMGWARLRAEVNPERRSNGSQFYITLRPAPRLDGFYSVFAQVVRGMETVMQLRPGDRILKVFLPKRKYWNPEKSNSSENTSGYQSGGFEFDARKMKSNKEAD